MKTHGNECMVTSHIDYLHFYVNFHIYYTSTYVFRLYTMQTNTRNIRGRSNTHTNTRKIRGKSNKHIHTFNMTFSHIIKIDIIRKIK